MQSPAAAFGPLLKQWRQAKRMSQEQLAEQGEVSARHISFVENGRSAPSRQMVLVLASALDMPLRDRNLMLSAAGFAPVYRESNLDSPEMQHVRSAIDLILAHQEPYPAIVVTHGWDLVKMNRGAARLFATFLESASDPIVAQNAIHALFHPKGIRNFIVNWEEVAGYLLDRLYREAMIEPPPG